jgi:hypothetical protein
MARVKFHGAFGSRAKAERKKKRVKGGSIRRIKVRGDTRYAVISKRGK